ncbi:hypothetical protein LSH36_839g02006 [Paralvinella palmiformis]|uniref:Archaemetzincin-2 n=1 Tax=Paralvinella palmiformis TaxID=53620 RepID=A0AAD9IZU3_9ANNE|nr:hypothetical protein LSH36_839g02006 [Paralvinella palmiformis]
MPRKVQSQSRFIPYARGFRAPSKKVKQKALIGHGECSSHISKEFADGEHFESVQKCQSIDDWLANVKENGQTYAQFINNCPWLSTRKWRKVNMKFVPSGETIHEKYPDGKIYIIPVGDLTTGLNNNLCILDVDDIIEYCQIFLGLPVVTLPAVSLVRNNGKVLWLEDKVGSRKKRQTTSVVLPSRYDKRSNHYQLHVAAVLEKLRKSLPDDAICLLGLTMYDLYEDDADLFVAGMAAGNHRVGLFSLFRYNPRLAFSKEYWYDITEIDSILKIPHNELMLQRGCKLVVHEICHLLGIDHCIFYLCCMNGSGHLEEDFRQPMFLCPIDLRKLHQLCGFDIIQRYEQLRGFFGKHHMEKECLWLERRLDFLRKG